MLKKILLGSALAAVLAMPAQAEELRIGFIAPITGIFAQVGKDMVDGFQLYLDQHGNKLGGMDVKFVVEDDQGKPDASVTKGKKVILQDKVHLMIGGLLASTGYALGRSQPPRRRSTCRRCRRDDLTQRHSRSIRTSCAPVGPRLCRIIRSASGLR